MIRPGRILFWGALLFLGGVFVHAVLLLWWPRHAMSVIMEKVEAAGGVNRLIVFSPDSWARIAARPDPAMLHAACLVVPGKGRVRLQAVISAAYWSVTLYGPSGTVLYALDDRFASRERITFMIEQTAASAAPGTLVTPELSEGRVRIPLAAPRAILVIRVHATWPGMRPRLLKALRESTCRHLPGNGNGNADAATGPQGAGSPGTQRTATGAPRPRQLPLPRPRPLSTE
jgi:uncharacterized membrane protein